MPTQQSDDRDAEDGSFEWITPPIRGDAGWVSDDGGVVESSMPAPLPHRDQIANRLREGGVDEVVLLHGTFVGSDFSGVLRVLSRYSPGVAETLAGRVKGWVDGSLGSLANFDPPLQRLIERLINPPGATPIPVRRALWSGENNPLGRLDAVIDILDRGLVSPNSGPCERKGFDEQPPTQPRRILVLAHSHGGNVMAMATSLLAADHKLRQSMLHDLSVARSTKTHSDSRQNEDSRVTGSAGPSTTTPKHRRMLKLQFDKALSSRNEQPAWQRVANALSDPATVWPTYDIVTLGTPIRYRFGHTGGRLLHWVNHHPLDPDHPERAVMPRSIDDLLQATGGDYIHQFGTTGTDFTPAAIALRDYVENRKLRHHFEPDTFHRFNLPALWNRITSGDRVAADGHTLLCDYPRDKYGAYRNILGHAVYTHPLYIPFHFDELTKRFLRFCIVVEGAASIIAGRSRLLIPTPQRFFISSKLVGQLDTQVEPCLSRHPALSPPSVADPHDRI